MSLRDRIDYRVIMLALAALVLAPVFTRPSVPVAEPVFDYLFVVDITQSMNVRDYTVDAQPVDRLNFVKATLVELLDDLSCGSRVGLGLFTGWQSTTLFDPIEVCHHRREIDDVVRHIDWRMTWVPQSNVARGVEDALNGLDARDQAASLVFLTDGDEAPPDDLKARFASQEIQPRPRGLVVGVGDLRPAAVPMVNEWGRTTGYFERNGETYLSSLKETYLRRLGRRAGLDYHHLTTTADLLRQLRSRRYAEVMSADRDISWVFGAIALGLMTAIYFVTPLVAASERFRHTKAYRQVG